MTSRNSHKFSLALALLAALVVAGCASQPEREVIRTESYVDIERFMGDWYVVASIPTFLEKDAFNATERYVLDDDGTIKTTFSFRKGGFDGKRKEYNPRGFIFDTASNAVWGMRFVWPFKSDYRVVYVNDDYSQTIIGRDKRDFVWIMARTPSIPDEDFFNHVQLIREQGYDTSKLIRVPQQWQVEAASLSSP